MGRGAALPLEPDVVARRLGKLLHVIRQRPVPGDVGIAVDDLLLDWAAAPMCPATSVGVSRGGRPS